MERKTVYLLFTLFLFAYHAVYAENTPIIKEKGTSAEDIRSGERLFHGFVPSATNTINCASCHNIGHIDTLNWNPSAIDLATKYRNKDFETFKKAITQPSGMVMSLIHKELQLNDDQIKQIRGYLLHLASQGEEKAKPLLTNTIIFILLILLFVGALVDLAITHKVKVKMVHLAVMLISAIFITRYTVNAAIDIGRSPNYQPDQPIKFSHKIHAGQNQTSCFYCHFNAEKSKFAGIPPLNVCTNCHVIVKEGSRSGKFEIAKIYEALESNKPVKWVKVHNLPDHVYFNHSQHVVAGKIDCMQCHGDVANMDQIVQVKDLSMGWCVNCHRETNVQFDNKFYGKYAQLHKDMREGKNKKVTVSDVGGTDCMKCHY
ncbi:MAG TPA: hypothetical protein VHO72_06070 [Bacteroidales bacterium]|nr:hypothetical protein [Bacteroidales bacterium]